MNFNENLSDSDRASLLSGEMVIRACPSAKKMCGQGTSGVIQEVLDDVCSFKPNYIAEVVKIYPIVENDDFIAKFESMMTDIPSDFTIPYYSDEAKKDMKLSLTYKNLSTAVTGLSTTANSDFTMAPFGLINTEIHTDRSDSTYRYSLTNTNKIKYKDFITCVSKGNMKLSLALLKSDDYWIVYGFVAADAPSIFFLRKKVEAAIVERAQAFCSYFFTQLD
ncbi:MAG: hypothetical protein K6G00_07220 [Treponema sp.]|nr:hypothetical protein [Treponema sp.]